MNVKKPFTQIIQPADILELQDAQYRDTLLLTGSVDASSGGAEFPVNVSNDGHFFCESITGGFTTLYNTGVIVDTGVCYLAGQLKHNSRNLFNSHISLDLLLCPGRKKSDTSTTVVTDPVGGQLFFPLPIEYMWDVNSNITMNVSNTSNVANTFWVAFHGYRICTGIKADSIRKKYR